MTKLEFEQLCLEAGIHPTLAKEAATYAGLLEPRQAEAFIKLVAEQQDWILYGDGYASYRPPRHRVH